MRNIENTKLQNNCHNFVYTNNAPYYKSWLEIVLKAEYRHPEVGKNTCFCKKVLNSHVKLEYFHTPVRCLHISTNVHHYNA